jgi:tetratricopeptide (TPR) repeat protein
MPLPVIKPVPPNLLVRTGYKKIYCYSQGMSRKKQARSHVPITCAVLLAWPVWNAVVAKAGDPGQAAAEAAVRAERRGDFTTAIAQFRQAIRDGMDNPQIRSNLGIAYFQTGDNPAALREFHQVLAKQPQFLPANVFSGLALLRLQRPKEAIPFLLKAHTAQPEAPDVTLALARAELASNHVASANALYNQAAGIDPQSAEAWFGAGITDRALAETEAKDARRSGQLKPGSLADGRIKRLLGESESAMRKGIALDPDSVRAEMIFAESFRIAERYDDAIREYRTITQHRPNFAPAWAGLAAAYSASGANDEAIKAALRAIALDPDDADSELLAAGLFLHAGDSLKAKPHAQRAVQLRPAFAAAHLVLAKVFIAERNPTAALPELKQAAAADTDGSANYLLAVTLRELGRNEEAAVAMQKFRQLHGGHASQR